MHRRIDAAVRDRIYVCSRHGAPERRGLAMGRSPYTDARDWQQRVGNCRPMFPRWSSSSVVQSSKVGSLIRLCRCARQGWSSHHHSWHAAPSGFNCINRELTVILHDLNALRSVTFGQTGLDRAPRYQPRIHYDYTRIKLHQHHTNDDEDLDTRLKCPSRCVKLRF